VADSVVDAIYLFIYLPYLFTFFCSDPDPGFNLNFGAGVGSGFGSGLLMKNTFELQIIKILQKTDFF
jgi:hypothetical protein